MFFDPPYSPYPPPFLKSEILCFFDAHTPPTNHQPELQEDDAKAEEAKKAADASASGDDDDDDAEESED